MSSRVFSDQWRLEFERELGRRLAHKYIVEAFIRGLRESYVEQRALLAA